MFSVIVGFQEMRTFLIKNATKASLVRGWVLEVWKLFLTPFARIYMR